MAKYVDGFVLVVPKKNITAYKKMARFGEKVWRKYGALDYKECMGDDLNIKGTKGWKPLPFRKLTKAKSNETVWFSYIVFKSKKHRDEVNAKVMKEMDKSMEKYKDMEVPFETKKFSYGGFQVMVE